jgi:hypothetical protein
MERVCGTKLMFDNDFPIPNETVQLLLSLQHPVEAEYPLHQLATEHSVQQSHGQSSFSLIAEKIKYKLLQNRNVVFLSPILFLILEYSHFLQLKLHLTYLCETWSLTLREEHGSNVFENRVLRRIFEEVGEN